MNHKGLRQLAASKVKTEIFLEENVALCYLCEKCSSNIETEK
jgi:hypothetical protein